MKGIDLIVFIGIIVADIILFLEVIYFVVRRTTSNRLIQAAFEKNETKFNEISNSFFGKVLNAFDKEYIRFNVANIQKDSKQVEESIKKINEMDLKKSQMKKIYPKIFYYYIDKNKKQEAKNYYEKLSQFDAYKEKRDIEMMYDTYINESHKYLDEALAKLDKVKKEELPHLEKAISKMYENKKINSEAKKYERLAERHQLELEDLKRR